MGNKIVRHRSPAVLLLVDVVNHFEFPDGEAILKNALQIAPRLARLKKRARDSNIPVVYVNDNFGQWRSDAGKLLAHCLRTDCAGKAFRRSGFNLTTRIIVFSSQCTRRFSRLHWNCCSDTWCLVHHPRGDCHEQLHFMHGARRENAGVQGHSGFRLLRRAFRAGAQRSDREYPGDGGGPGRDTIVASPQNEQGRPWKSSLTADQNTPRF